MRKPIPAFCLLCYVSMVSFSFTRSAMPTATKSIANDSAFSSWYYTPSGVFGRKLISKTTHRSYFKIARPAGQPVSVFEYNAAGVIVNTTRITFSGSSIALIAKTNQWDEAFDSTWFKPDGTDEFIVTERMRGQNPFLPSVAMRYVYKNSLLQETTCLADSTKPGYNQEGVSRYRYERYNDPLRFGLVKRESYFGEIDNALVSRKTGAHSVLNEYNENGNQVSTSLYGLHDEPVEDGLGNFRTKMSYDNNDDEVEIDYFDAKGNPGNDRMGYSRKIADYKKGFLKTETCYNNEFVIVKPSKYADFISTTKHQYDDSGNELERTYFDQDGFPLKDARGIQQVVYAYNSSGMLTDVSYFDDRGRPVTDASGICHVHYGRTGDGKIASVYGINILNIAAKEIVENVFETKLGYDSWGRTSSISYWANDSVKMVNRSGCQQVSTLYDQNGLATQYIYTDEQGKPVAGRKGFSRQTLQYNDQALIEKRAYFDGSKPVMLSDTDYATSNYHSITYEYDFNNRVRTLLYTDTDGRPVDALLKIDNPMIRCRKIEFNYNGLRIVSENFFDASGNAPTTVDCENNNCLTASGTTIMLKRLDRLLRFPAVRKNPLLAKARDTSLYARQLAFLNHDSILIFLDQNAARLSEQGCATFYRIAAINKYYQMQGDVVDYYVNNDTIAAKLTYVDGQLSGPCTYYYSNGKVKEKGGYKENVRNGEWMYYYESGLESKKVKFKAGVPYLVDFYDETGRQLTKDGNGNFLGAVLTGNVTSPMTYTIIGAIKDGWMNGEWKLYNSLVNTATNIEKFSSGQFQGGRSFGVVTGETSYRGHYYSQFENVHPGERLDYYGPNYTCELFGAPGRLNVAAGRFSQKDMFDEITAGMINIFRSNKYHDYSGWVFLDLYYDEQGVLTKKIVRLFQENPAFQQEIGQMLDHISSQPPASGTTKRAPFDKFYIVLVEANQLVIPEQALQNARRNTWQ